MADRHQLLATHLFELDPVGHAGHRGERPCRACPCKHCPVPQGNRVHDAPADVPEQAEHRRRIGDDT